MKKIVFSALIVVLSATSVFAAPKVPKVDRPKIEVSELPRANYRDIEDNVKAQLNQAVINDDRDGIALYGAALEQIAKARYLENASWLNDVIVRPLVEGFRPQIDSLPTVAKTIMSGAVREELIKDESNKILPHALNWLLSTNSDAAKLAVGDFQSALDGYFSQKIAEKRDIQRQLNTKPRYADTFGDEWVQLDNGKWYNVNRKFEVANKPSSIKDTATGKTR